MLILLHIITDDDAWTTSSPLKSTELLARTTSYYTEIVTLWVICIWTAVNNDLPF